MDDLESPKDSEKSNDSEDNIDELEDKSNQYIHMITSVLESPMESASVLERAVVVEQRTLLSLLKFSSVNSKHPAAPRTTLMAKMCKNIIFSIFSYIYKCPQMEIPALQMMLTISNSVGEVDVNDHEKAGDDEGLQVNDDEARNKNHKLY